MWWHSLQLFRTFLSACLEAQSVHMRTPMGPESASHDDLVRAVLPGLLLASLTLLVGFGLGVVFGLNEEAITSRLAASAAEGASGGLQR